MLAFANYIYNDKKYFFSNQYSAKKGFYIIFSNLSPI